MSVFGGDSWAREAEYRKRRVDDVIIQSLDVSSYKKLPSGKYACLVCPHSPILDSPLMFSMHCKGSRHLAAETRLKERELMKQDEINKRVALSDSFVGSANSSFSDKKVKFAGKPLIERTRKAAHEILYSYTPQQDSRDQSSDVKVNKGVGRTGTTNLGGDTPCPAIIESDKAHTQQLLDFRARRERELKFIEAGWKRDCHGKWFRDENVEFDSDEEDPNISLG